jgi:poly-gamma-glutamate synthase PgsB/CapB
MTVLLLSLTGVLLYLIAERVMIDRWRRCIPLTIIVTGTRGKSSVVRLLASIMRADGRKVLGKTTGSSPRFLWPDGSETDIKRRGAASILEQKHLLKEAASRKIECLVAEVMSIHPENHFVEAQQILRADIVAITNFWPDHIDAQGTTEESVAATLCLDIPERATVIAPALAKASVLESCVASVDGKLLVVEEDTSKPVRQRAPELDKVEFTDNIDLAYGLAKHLGIDDEVVARGLEAANRDIGALSMRELLAGNPEKRLILVNAFAANDPKSTLRVYAKARELLPENADWAGLLCLRSDRADRTAQWIESLQSDPSKRFSRLYVIGGHAPVVARKLGNARRLKHDSAVGAMDTIANDVADGTVVFGFGNFVGMGEKLVELWTREGVAYGI